MALNNRLSDIISNFNILNDSQINTINKLSNMDGNINILANKNLNKTKDSVDAGLDTYAWNNDINSTEHNALSVQLCGLNNVNTNEINNLLVNDETNGLLVTDTNINTAFDNVNNAIKVNLVSGTITGADGKAYLYDGSTTNAITSTAVTSDIRGIDTASALYVSDGTTLTALTATDAALDVNIKSGTITGADGKAYLYDGSTTNAITSTAVTSDIRGIDTASALYTTDGTSLNAITSTNSALDVNVVNSTVTSEKQNIIYELLVYNDILYRESSNNAELDTYIYGIREGWYWTNKTINTSVSNLYWYLNIPEANIYHPSISKTDMATIYMKLILNQTSPSTVLPFIYIYSNPTGVDDIIPDIAHSVWKYTISATEILINGEEILLVIGDQTKISNIFSTVRRINLELSQTQGDCLSTEIINIISLSTVDDNTLNIGAVQFLIQNSGYYYSTVDTIIQYEFKNSSQFQIKINLAGYDDDFIPGKIKTNILGVYNNSSKSLICSNSGVLSINVNSVDQDDQERGVNCFNTHKYFEKNIYSLNTASALYTADGTTITAITSTSVTSDIKGIDTASALYSTDGSTRTAITSTNSALDVNIKSNETIPSLIDDYTYYNLNTFKNILIPEGNLEDLTPADVGTDDGWVFSQNTLNDFIKIYWYGGQSFINIFNTSNLLQFQYIKAFYCIITLTNNTNIINVRQYIEIYSQPTGFDDYFPEYAHSKWEYTVSTGNFVNGEKIMLVFQTNGELDNLYPNIRHINLGLATTYGECNQNETIEYMNIKTISPTDGPYMTSFILHEAGYYDNSISIIRKFKYTGFNDNFNKNNTFYKLNNSLNDNNLSVVLKDANNDALTSTNSALDVNIKSNEVILSLIDNYVCYDLDNFKGLLIPEGNIDNVDSFFNGIDDGWLFKQFTINDFIRIYWYSDSPIINLFCKTNNLTFDNLKAFYCVITLTNNTNVNVRQFIEIYSEPTGFNDYFPDYAHSKWEFTISTGNFVNGEKIMLVFQTNGELDNLYTNIRHINLGLSSTYGECIVTEKIKYMNIRTEMPTTDPELTSFILHEAGHYNNNISIINKFKYTHFNDNINKNNVFNKFNLGLDTNGTLNVILKTEDNSIITSSNVTSDIRGIDTASALYSTDGITRTAITCTDTALDVNINNTSVAVTGAFYPATQPVSGTVNSQLKDGSGTSITSSAVSSLKTGIDTAASLYITDGTTRTPLTATSNALDVNIKSGTLSADGKAYLYDGSTTNAITSTAVTSSIRGIDTSSALYISDGTTRTPLTATDAALDVNIKSGTITGADGKAYLYDGSTTNAITSTAVTSSIRGIDTSSALYTTDGTTRTAITATDAALDVNINNNSLDVISNDFEKDYIIYDMDTNGNYLYVDTINPPRIDIFGREGFYWTNAPNQSTISNIYWYSNINDNQTTITKAEFSTIYTIISLDNTLPLSVRPLIYVYSRPTGINDAIVGVAHSVWTYTISTTEKLINGEEIMLITGDQTKVSNIRPDTRRIILELSNTQGDALDTEIINVISLSTIEDITLSTYSVAFIIKYSGFYYSILDKLIQYKYKNSLNRLKTEILAGLEPTSSRNILNTLMYVTNDYGGYVKLRCNNNSILKNTLYDANNNAITSTAVTSDISGIDTSSALYSTDGTTRTAITATDAALDVNIKSGTITGADGKAYLYDGSTTNAITSTAVTSSIRGIDTSSALYTTDGTTRTALTSTTNLDGIVGLNMYQITPKSFTYKMSGYSTRTSSYTMLGGQGSNLAYQNSEIYGQFGLGWLRPWYIFAVAGSTVPRIFSYDYVNSSGDLITGTTINVVAVGVAYVLAGGANIACVNNYRQLSSATTSDQFYITNNNSTLTAYATCNVQQAYQQWQSVITVPNNCVGYITNMNGFSSYDARCGVLKWDTSGYRTIEYSTLLKAGTTQYISSGYEGSLGGIIKAGETIGLAKFDSSTGGAVEINATIVIKYLS